MLLKPDGTRTENGVLVQEKIIPWGAVWVKDYSVYKKGDRYKADRLLSAGTGKVCGVTIHNTDGSANAETYTRATYPNQNMRDSRVHYYCDDVEAWQNLNVNEVGWHAGDGRGNGNETTVSIEVIMRGAAVKDDAKAEDNGARLAAAILTRHGLTVDQLYTHNHWMGLPDTIVSGAGKNCPLFILPHWAEFKAKVQSYMPQDTSGYTMICGASKATAEQMRTYLSKLNANAPDYAALYIAEGEREGIRGDVAFAQSCLETGNFTFAGSAVTLEQNNFCGMGVTANGVKGNSFKTPEIGIRAQIQHLKAYACKDALSYYCADPRYSYVTHVTRGSAAYVEWLGIQENPAGKGWAAGKDYGAKILKILAAIIATDVCVEDAPGPDLGAGITYVLKPEIDNTPYEWEKKAIETAISRGIIAGDTSGNLRLHDPASRADVLVFLERCGAL
jgi:hypothetical protein